MEFTKDARDKKNELYSKRRLFVDKSAETTKLIVNSLTPEQRQMVQGQWFDGYYIYNDSRTNIIKLSMRGVGKSRWAWELNPETQWEFINWLEKM